MSTTVEYILEIDSGSAQKSLKKTSAETKKTAQQMTKMRKNARGVTGSTQAVSEALNFLAPELVTLGVVFAGTAKFMRGFQRTLASGNVLMIAATLAAVGLVAGYALFTRRSKAVKEAQELMTKSIKENNLVIAKNKDLFNDSKNALGDHLSNLNQLTLEYQALTGAITQAEAAEMTREAEVAKASDEFTSELKKQLKSLEGITTASRKNVEAIAKNKKVLDSQGKLFTLKKGTLKLTKLGVEFRKKEEAAQNKLNIAINKENDLRSTIAKTVLSFSSQYLKVLSDTANEEKRQQQRQDAIARQKERTSKLQSIISSLVNQENSLTGQLFQLRMQALTPLEKVIPVYQNEIMKLDQISQQIEDQAIKAVSIARSKKDQVLVTEILAQKEESLAAVQLLREEQLKKATKERFSLLFKGLGDALKSAKTLGKAQSSTVTKRIADQKKVFELQKIAQDDQITELQKINNLEKERLDTLDAIAKKQGISVEEAKKQVQARAERERKALDKSKIQEKIEVSFSAVMSGSGLISAVSGLFGPTGGIVGTILTGLSDLGQKDPEQIQADFEATFQGIAKGIKVALPLIFEMLPPILFEAAKMIINGMITAVATLVAQLSKAIAFVFGKIFAVFKDPITFFRAIGKEIGLMFKRFFDLIVEPFKRLFGGSKMGGGRMLTGQGGLRFTGANRGLAMLHEGEMVVPRSGQISSSVARDAQIASGSNGSINITINSAITERSAIDGLVRKIEERFQGFGQSTSPLFGGI